MKTTLDTPKTTTLKATIETVRYLKQKRGYVARLADTGWQVEGTTKDQILEQLRNVLKRQEQFLHTRKYLRKGNVTFSLYYANGWQYDIVRDNGQHSTSMLTCNSYADALEQMMKHVEQFGE